MSERESVFSELTPSEGVDEHASKEAKKLRADIQHGYAANLASPAAVGDLEQNAREAAAAFVPLHVSGEVKRHAAQHGAPLGEYEISYTSYLFPLRATLRALGRLSDLNLAGAPLEPQAANASLFPKLSATEKKVGKVDHGDAQAAFGAWSAQQSDLRIAVNSQGASDLKLQLAMTMFQTAQSKLSRMAKEAQKAGKEARKAEIDQTVDTLVKIVEVSKQALATMASVESLVNQSFDPEDVEPSMIGKDAGSQQEIDDAKAAGASTRSAQQKGIDGASRIAKALKVPVDKAKGWLSGAGFNARDLFMIATGNAAEYDHLTRDIQRLDGQIKNLGLDIELSEIKEGHEALEAFSMDFTVSGQAVHSKQASARKAAASFGQQLGAGTQGVMTMYVANAYEELAMFGANAEHVRASAVDPKSRPIAGYLRDEGVQLMFRSSGWGHDYETLAENVSGVWAAGDYMEKKLPEWQARAQAWEAFLEQMTGTDLVE